MAIVLIGLAVLAAGGLWILSASPAPESGAGVDPDARSVVAWVEPPKPRAVEKATFALG